MAMVVVLGALNIDLIMKVPRQPQPGETILTPTYDWSPGGKGGNQAIACSRSGVKTAMVGQVGDDGFGTRLLNTLKRDEVLASGVARHESEPTGMAFITVEPDGENRIIVAKGANNETTGDQVPDDILHPKNVVLMQMEINAAENWDVIHRAKKAGGKTILNLAPAGAIPREVMDDLDFLIVNQIEGRQMAEAMKLKIEDSAVAIASKLAVETQTVCVMTLGPHGCIAKKPDGTGWKVAAIDLGEELVDTTGAGDTFCGVFAGCIFKNKSIQDSLRRASAAASLACRALGAQTAMPRDYEIDEAVELIPQAEGI